MNGKPLTKKELIKILSDCPNDDSSVFFTDESGDQIGFVTDAYVRINNPKTPIWIEITTQAQR